MSVSGKSKTEIAVDSKFRIFEVGAYCHKGDIRLFSFFNSIFACTCRKGHWCQKFDLDEASKWSYLQEIDDPPVVDSFDPADLDLWDEVVVEGVGFKHQHRLYRVTRSCRIGDICESPSENVFWFDEDTMSREMVSKGDCVRFLFTLIDNSLMRLVLLPPLLGGVVPHARAIRLRDLFASGGNLNSVVVRRRAELIPGVLLFGDFDIAERVMRSGIVDDVAEFQEAILGSAFPCQRVVLFPE